MKARLIHILKHRLFIQAVLLFVGAGMIFYGYRYYIKPLMTEIETVERNVMSVNKAKLRKEVKQREEKKKAMMDAYEKLRGTSGNYNSEIYKDKYNVAVDILEKLNSSSFNIYEYTLNKSYDEIKLKISGSYLNLIKFFDFLQTVKADIDIETYRIELKERKMFIKLQVKIGILKI